MESSPTITCIVCKGCGVLPSPTGRGSSRKYGKAKKSDAARILINAKYSHRQVAELLGLKSVKSVYSYLRTAEAKKPDSAIVEAKKIVQEFVRESYWDVSEMDIVDALNLLSGGKDDGLQT